MNKHTPGPWQIYARAHLTVKGATGFVVASCGGYLNNQRDDLDVELSANAKLIAAAPDLLEALVEVTASLAWNAHGECRAIHEGPIMPSSGAVEMARAAIAKATQ